MYLKASSRHAEVANYTQRNSGVALPLRRLGPCFRGLFCCENDRIVKPQWMPCRRLCIGALAWRVLCIVARSLAWPQKEQGDQRDDWGNAGDGKPGIV